MRTSVPLLVVCLAAPVFAGPEDPAFDAPKLILGTHDRIDKLLDLDGDGVMDGIGWYNDAANSGIADFRMYRNDGTGEFTQFWNRSFSLSGSFWSSFNVADIDGDGRDDFAVTFGKRVHLYRSLGFQAPYFVASLTVNNWIENVEFVDVTGNGYLDLIVKGNREMTLFHVADLIGPPSVGVAVSGLLDGMVRRVDDLDGDGIDDVVVASTGTVAVYHPGPGSLTPGASFATTSPYPIPVAFDQDGDGDQDIALFDRRGTYELLRRQPGGTYTFESSRPGGPATELVDLDGDGDDDGIWAGLNGGSGGASPNTAPTVFEIAWNDDGVFRPSVRMEGIGASRLAGVADVDQDGDPDLVAGRSILYGGPGLSGDAPDLQPRVSVDPNRRMRLSDADGDGDLDLNVGSDGVHRNNGQGMFTSSAVTLPDAPAGTQWWAGPTFTATGYPGDFDGDGVEDLIVRQYQVGGGFLGMRLLVNNGDGTYRDGGPAADPGVNFDGTAVQRNGWAELSHAADVDRDGDVDLFVFVKRNRLWLNDGNGYFTQGWIPFTQESVQAVVDMDQDGELDVVTSNYNATIYYGRGNGTFEKQTFAIYPDPDTVQGVGDADADGDIDLMFIGLFSSSIQYVRNDGGRNYTVSSMNQIPLDSTQRPAAIHLVDLDDDGLEDVIAGPASIESSTSWVMRQTAPGVWDAPYRQVFRAFDVGDVDGDGDPDLTTQSLDEVLVDVQSIVRNRRYEGPAAGSIRQYGTGFPGTGGHVPNLGGSGPTRVGDSAALHLSGAMAGQVALMMVSLQESDVPNFPKPGMNGYAFPWIFYMVLPIQGPPGVPGAGGFELNFTVAPSLADLPVFHQVLIRDPGSTTGWAASNGLAHEYRPAYP